eukprot:snap_masked-scaffold1486_size38793-processed-gene-0.1 protein:Tk01003 transcript:snap_masked-scaffold1486_size38793-processed-gene-0.1-mRNA-1 annotation:"hypothetical protein EAG_00300"
MKEKRLEEWQKILGFLKRHGSNVKIFSDKKIFTVDQVYNRQNDRFIAGSPEEVKGVFRTKHPAQVMVLGVLAIDGKKMPPNFFRVGEKIGANEYYKVLRYTVLPWLKAQYPEDNYVWTQDGFLPTHSLKCAIMEVWASYPEDVVAKAYHSFRQRIEAVALNDCARTVLGKSRRDHVTINSLLTNAGLTSVNAMATKAVAVETWSAFSSIDGPDGGKNAIGDLIFPAHHVTRPTRAGTAGEVAHVLRNSRDSFVQSAVCIWNKYPELQELANRGHEVTVVMPYAHGKEIKNVEQIIIENEMEAALN